MQESFVGGSMAVLIPLAIKGWFTTGAPQFPVHTAGIHAPDARRELLSATYLERFHPSVLARGSNCLQKFASMIVHLGWYRRGRWSLKRTLVHITATVSQVSVYSLAATLMSPAMAVHVGQRAVSVFVSVTEEEECSWCSSQCPRVFSVFVVAIVRRTGS